MDAQRSFPRDVGLDFRQAWHTHGWSARRGTGLPAFTGSIGPGFVAACVCLVLGGVIVGGSRRAGRRGFVSRPLGGKSVLSGCQSGSWADLGQRWRPATTRGVRPRFVVRIRSALPLVWFFPWEGDGERHALSRGGEFRRSGGGQDTKHKNKFDLGVAEFNAPRRAGRSSALTNLLWFLRRVVLGRVAASVRPSVEV